MTFCKNCATQIDDAAAVCPNCGVARGVGMNYCPNCAAATDPNAVVCTQCGVSLKSSISGAKSKMAAGLFGIFLGAFGVHNFYLGYTGKAVAQLLITLLTCGFGATVSGIWGLIEGILILAGSSITTDAQGVPLSD